ncbi:hypothetical protein LC087_18810 (plasmid) [Bacillus carboniphilus]|uniref:Uncharacterized protein n=1 Tax=Bacillus carboniphilus TaxID=86663 RepID=A0ABY9K3R6_9BACI|nr:hypothetical protein [Bacillus carboniphilus]WLR44435.1 hypothetical protein LC087_18810 [Bacillus carboniphilus]
MTRGKEQKATRYQTVTSDQMVPSTSYQTVPSIGYQTVPSAEPESVEPVKERESLNKSLNKDLNKSNNLSIMDKLKESKEIHSLIEKSIDRITPRFLETIVKVYEQRKDFITDEQFKRALSKCIGVKPKKSYEAMLNTYLDNELRTDDKAEQNNPVDKPAVRREKLPKWMENEDKSSKTPTDDKKPVNANFEREKAQLETKLKDYYAKKKNNNLVDHG